MPDADGPAVAVPTQTSLHAHAHTLPHTHTHAHTLCPTHAHLESWTSVGRTHTHGLHTHTHTPTLDSWFTATLVTGIPVGAFPSWWGPVEPFAFGLIRRLCAHATSSTHAPPFYRYHPFLPLSPPNARRVGWAGKCHYWWGHSRCQAWAVSHLEACWTPMCWNRPVHISAICLPPVHQASLRASRRALCTRGAGGSLQHGMPP